MRRVVLDTETTGLSAGLGDRIVELGCIEVLNRQVTGNHFHRYINPERESEVGALKVHGITHEFLQDKPKFGEIVAEFLDYIQGAELVIHNAAFDVEFLNLELDRVGHPPIEQHCAAIVDTLSSRASCTRGRKIRSTRCASATRSITRTARSTVRCSTRRFSRRSILP